MRKRILPQIAFLFFVALAICSIVGCGGTAVTLESEVVAKQETTKSISKKTEETVCV